MKTKSNQENNQPAIVEYSPDTLKSQYYVTKKQLKKDISNALYCGVAALISAVPTTIAALSHMSDPGPNSLLTVTYFGILEALMAAGFFVGSGVALKKSLPELRQIKKDLKTAIENENSRTRFDNQPQ